MSLILPITDEILMSSPGNPELVASKAKHFIIIAAQFVMGELPFECVGSSLHTN